MTLPEGGPAGAGNLAAAAWVWSGKEMENFFLLWPEQCPFFPSLAPELSVPVWVGLGLGCWFGVWFCFPLCCHKKPS